jgi:ABC-2 type transport system ATP-binding protein
MLWFCGGHGVCLTKPGDATRVQKAVIAWLNRYVQRDKTIDTGPRFETVDQNGAPYVADDYPVPTAKPVTATGQGTLRFVAGGGSGPSHPPAGSKDVLAGIAGSITPAKATNAVDVAVTVGSRAVLLGEPQLRLTYRGTTPKGVRPTRVFAQLVDDATGIVVGNQVTPIAVTLDGKPHDVSVPLEAISFTGQTGARLTLQLVATTVAYAEPRLGGSVQFDRIDVALPVATSLRAG